MNVSKLIPKRIPKINYRINILNNRINTLNSKLNTQNDTINELKGKISTIEKPTNDGISLNVICTVFVLFGVYKYFT